MNLSKIDRVDMLDYMRGIMAFAVLIYHYSAWSDISFVYPLDQVVSRLGIYAVSAFYVLSGASLAYVYFHKKVNKEFLGVFILKRFFRIAPLLWVVTTATIALNALTSFMGSSNYSFPDLKTLVLNYTLTYGWLSPDSYIATGAWSIGNELVFYSIFPIMLYLITKSNKLFALFGIFTIGISFYFSEVLMDNGSTLTNEWSLYINPLNQLYLFVAGFLIGYLLRKGVKIPKRILLPVLMLSVLLFTFLPTSEGDRLLYAIGMNKILFSLAIFGIATFAAFWGNVKRNFATNSLKFLGDISYSVYLIHPLAYIVANKIMELVSVNNTGIKLTVGVLLTVIASSLVYKLIEKPFVEVGKKASKRLSDKQIKTNSKLKAKSIN